MTTEKVTYQGEVFCKVGNLTVNLLMGQRVGHNGQEYTFTKVLCPYFFNGTWVSNKCEQGGKCGIAEGASR